MQLLFVRVYIQLGHLNRDVFYLPTGQWKFVFKQCQEEFHAWTMSNKTKRLADPGQAGIKALGIRNFQFQL